MLAKNSQLFYKYIVKETTTKGETVRKRVLVLAAVLALAGCGGGPNVGGFVDEGTGVTNPARAEPSISAPVSIDTVGALKFTLEAVGITDVHPVATPDQKIAAWAVVPKFKKCPMFFSVVNGDSYRVTHLRKPDGSITPMNMEGTPLSPSALDIANWGANNLGTALTCKGGDAPADKDWPTTAPTP